MMTRRRFLGSLRPWLSLLAVARLVAGRPDLGALVGAREIAADVVIVGGGLGGCAAALAALAERADGRHDRADRLDRRPAHAAGRAARRAPLDRAVRRQRLATSRSGEGFATTTAATIPLTAEALAGPHLNPGNGGVSRLCHEPRVALAVLTAMLAPYASGGRLLGPARARAGPGRGRRATASAPSSVRDLQDRATSGRLVAPYFLDATELGDLLPLAGVEFVTGFEARRETGDDRTPGAGPARQSAVVHLLLRHGLPRRARTTRSTGPPSTPSGAITCPKLTPAWPGKLLGLDDADPITLKPSAAGVRPDRARARGSGSTAGSPTPRNFRPRHLSGGGITLVNWPQNDYWLGNLDRRDARARPTQHVARAKQLSLSLLYWLQTECPRPDGGTGWKGLRLRPDLVGTDRRPGQGPLHPRVAADPGRVHRPGAARRHRGPPQGARAARTSTAEPFPDSRRRRQLPDRPAPEHRRRQLHRRQLAAVPDPARAP